jgi:hypothetical protein
MTLRNEEHSYAECQLCWVSFMLSVTYKHFMLSVVMRIVIRLIVVAPLPWLSKTKKEIWINQNWPFPSFLDERKCFNEKDFETLDLFEFEGTVL